MVNEIKSAVAIPVGAEEGKPLSEEDFEDDTQDTSETPPAESNFDLGSDDDENSEDDHAVIEIFNSKCLKCSHLVDFEVKKYKDCHFTKGNTYCPAQSMKIVVRIPLEKIVNSFITAERTGDNARLGRLFATLAEKPEWYQQRVNTAVKQARVDHRMLPT